MSSPILQSIIHTLAFYDAVGGVPLTKIELYKYLAAAPSLELSFDKAQDKSSLRFSDFLEMLENQWSYLGAYIDRKRGFYFLKKNTEAYAKRIGGGKTGIKKWRIAKRMAKVISFLPYVRMIAITGSLALHTTNKDSDIDVLIAAKGGHIWTTRVLVSALTHVLRKRRHKNKIRDRICLNHYVSDSENVLRPRHLFSAHICATLVPVWKQKSYIPPFLNKNSMHLAAIRAKPRLLYYLRDTDEWFLSKTIARAMERVLRAVQARRIKGRKFIADDNALVFHHPRPQNQEALYLYEQNLRDLKLSPIYPQEWA
jgi:predicted nucleotidyltransferase